MRCVPLCVSSPCKDAGSHFWVRFWGARFGYQFASSGTQLCWVLLLGPHSSGPIFGSQKWTLFGAERVLISRPQKRPCFEPRNGCHKFMFFGIVAGKSASATAFSCPQASGMMRLPVQRVLLCCAALARVHWKLSPRT